VGLSKHVAKYIELGATDREMEVIIPARAAAILSMFKCEYLAHDRLGILLHSTCPQLSEGHDRVRSGTILVF